ncbi:transcriptional regulator with XRE-family HTH domain [Anaerotaenia torta]|uniref:helix-turn-helix domain-containing protein n=1 Tax=Anaerotaenia torta TaxID=433293 RepID=UPI003D25FD51
MNFPGLLIRRTRLEKGWSQQGLCDGICAVSYLSKIEQGKAEPSAEVLELLLKRLDIVWHTGKDARKAKELTEQIYDAAGAMDAALLEQLFQELEENREAYVNGPCMLDMLLFDCLQKEMPDQSLELFESVMNERQRTLWFIINERYEEALRLSPSPLSYALTGLSHYRSGSYTRAEERLWHAFHLAAEDCLVHVMLFCRLILGNCYSDLNQNEAMLHHYRAAERLATALNNKEILRDIRYNIASTQIQFKHYQKAYSYFSTIKEPTVMDLHKLAICCEGLGYREEALTALERTADLSPNLIDPLIGIQMCEVVRYRLTHSNYLHDETYGHLLIDCFQAMRSSLPRGYAAFHLPWVEAWYTANRQYRQAWELLRDFPSYASLTDVKG